MKNKLRYLYHELIPHMLRSVAAPGNQILLLFTIDGILITLVNNLIDANNNLFANRLGAGDYELSLVIMLPQLVAMMILLPGGILTDRMKDKKNMVSASLTVLAVVYILIGFVPFFGPYKLIAYLGLLALSLGPMTLYNLSWQSFFSDVVPIDKRNNILTFRTGVSFLIGITILLISGALLASVGAVGQKIMFHQGFYWVASILLLVQSRVLKRVKNATIEQSARINMKEFKLTLKDLIHNRKFLGFISVALFFYITWHVDWTLYFIGQTQYLQMNEVWLSWINIGKAIIQFLSIGLWSRINSRRGVRFGIIFASVGLAFCPISMIVSTSLPLEIGRVVFLVMNTVSCITLAITSLNLLQCLLQVLPEKNKTLNISIYTIMVTLSNAVMPLVGVTIYTKLGADLAALQLVFAGVFVLRIIATGLWTFRWWRLRLEPK